MAHNKGTGKSWGTTITFGGASIPTGWRKITIERNFKPLAATIDTTVAGDSAYVFTEDPLGGKGGPSCQITVEGFMSVTDHQDSGLSATALGTTGDVVVIETAGEDTFTAAGATFDKLSVGAQFAQVVPYTAVFVLQNSAGAWS